MALSYLSFYLRGREDATADFDTSDVDLGRLAREVQSGKDMREACADVVRRELATDETDGTKSEWLDGEAAECKRRGLSCEKAWEAWCRGYVDEAAGQIESAVVDVLWEDVEREPHATPAPARSAEESHGAITPERLRRVLDQQNPSPRGIATSPGTYAAWYETGRTDAASSWDATELDEELQKAVRDYETRPSFGAHRRAEEAVEAYLDYARDEAQKHWMEQHRQDAKADRLDPKKAYKAWEDGFKSRYVEYATQEILRRAQGA